MNSVFLAKHRDKRLRRGHPWVFSNEITQIEGSPEVGELVRVCRMDGAFLGIGFYHPHSLIAVRLLTRQDQAVDRNFFRNRLIQSIRSRRLVYPNADALRLVHSESDGLPGLIIDMYNKAVSIQINSAGMEQQLPVLAELIDELIKPDVIVLRNDSSLRNLEGLPIEQRVLTGDPNAVVQMIHEDGVKYKVDALHGQKTGFYLDQRENRATFARFVNEGDHVFDAFCNEGGFALHAARAGASRILAADQSGDVLDRASVNAHLNGVDAQIEFRRCDLMKEMQSILAENTFDAINLDPPNFTRSKKNVGTARQAYRRLHQSAIDHLKPGGILATSSCSHHITEETFLESVHLAAERSGKSLKIVFRGSHPIDHPVLLGMPETEYLKFFVFQIM
jgi:23S rRNA (cytosine1962-C5)-methyltransferase